MTYVSFVTQCYCVQSVLDTLLGAATTALSATDPRPPSRISREARARVDFPPPIINNVYNIYNGPKLKQRNVRVSRTLICNRTRINTTFSKLTLPK